MRKKMLRREEWQQETKRGSREKKEPPSKQLHKRRSYYNKHNTSSLVWWERTTSTVIIIIKCYNINIANVIEKCYSINIVASLFNYRAVFLILVIVLFSVFYFLSEKYFKLRFLKIIQKVWIFIQKKGQKFSNVHISKVGFTKCSNVWLHRSYIIIIILLNYEMLISAKSKSWRS